jgi:hypothetical protein
MVIDTSSWKEFEISVLFDCVLSKGDLKEEECSDGPIPLISSGSTNNGVVKFIGQEGDGKAEIFDGNCLTVDMFCNCFYQPIPFYAVSHGRVNVLIPKFQMNADIGLFLATLINMEQFKYSYGRAVYSSVVEQMKIKLPVDENNEPDWKYMEDCVETIQSRENGKEGSLRSSLETKNNNPLRFDTNDWKLISFNRIFVIKKGSRLTKDDMEEGSINFIGAIDNNNGVREKIGNGSMFPGNCITVNYNGSVGEAFYQFEPFWASDDVNVLFLRDREMNKYIGLFLCSLIKMEKFKFSYGRKWNLDQMKNSFLKLPLDENGEPNWEFMESYIKSLPFGDRI